MKVTKEVLQNVATLSRLSIAESEEDKYMNELDKFLTYVDNLSQVNTDDIQPTTYALPMQNVFREDVVKPSLSREKALQNAPLQDNGYFKVPKVLDE